VKNERSCADKMQFALRVFDGDGARRPEPPAGLSDELTLRMLYERDFKLRAAAFRGRARR
jgi:hypothetical protein